jgi:Domain of unknown function (DUF4168)
LRGDGRPHCVIAADEIEREKSVAKDNFKSQGGDAALRSSDVSDQVVSQVGKAAVEILKLRQSLEESLATAQTEDDRETLTSQVEMAAVRAIDEQGLTIDEYNDVLSAARSDQELEERVLLACKAA